MTTTESGPEASIRLGKVLLEARGTSKFFPGVRTLEGVGFTLRTGEVYTPIDENGADKSTLMKVLSGLYQPDEGKVLVRGEPITLSTPLATQQAGISAIRQESFLMSHLTTAQSMSIGHEPRLFDGLLDHKKLNDDIVEFLGRLGVKIDPHTQVGKSTVASQQLLEIVRAFSFNSKVLIMDEPTVALGDAEMETLFRIMDGFTGPDTGIVYISHHMEEVCRKSTRIAVLRDRKLVDNHLSSEVIIPKIIQLMVGRKLAFSVRPEPRGSTEMILNVGELSTAGLFKDVSSHLEKGEILGFAGLMSAGHIEVTWVLIGVDPRTGGIVTVGSKQVGIHSPKGAVKIGIGYLSEDRGRYGLVLRQDITASTVLPSLKRLSTGGLLQGGRMRKATRKWVGTLVTKTPNVHQQTRNLSGGDQRGVVLAKWLEYDCDIPIFDEPIRGIDADTKREIYDLLDELTGQGKSIIMISSEMGRALRMSGRIAVMCNGRVTGFPPNVEATQEKIMKLAAQFTTIGATSEVN